MHRLLQRQINKLLPEDLRERADMQDFLNAIEEAYAGYDRDHDQIERTLEISSNELFKSNQQLNDVNASLEAKVELRTKQSEKLANELLEAQSFARMGTFEIDFIQGTSNFTEQGAKLLNLDLNELKFDVGLIKRLRKNVIKEDLNKIDSAWVNAMQNREEVRLDFRIRNQVGEITCLNWNVRPDFDDRNRLVRVTGTLQDVTERMLMEESSKMARLIIENSPTVLFRWRMADNFPVEFVSENISQFGYQASDFLQGKIAYADVIYKEDLERIKNEVKEFHESGTLLYTQTYRILTSDGKLRWVEDRTMVERAEEGQAPHHQGLITDITERVNAQNALESSEKRFRTMVQNSSDITSLLTAEGVVAYESASFYRMFGYEPDEVIGHSAMEFVHPDDIPHVVESLGKLVLEGGDQPPVVFRFRAKNGNWVYLEAIGNNQLSEPSISGVVVNSRDVTERIESEMQMRSYAETLEKINKELDQFAYIVSHDLKAPLRAINNLSIWIEEDLAGKMEADTQKNFDMLRGRIHRMESLINGILNYSRAGRQKSENLPIDLNTFISDIVTNLAPPEHFKVFIQENLPVIQAEKIAIDQVFSNFISNAIKYNSDPNPEIRITCEDLGVMYKFGVSDNGPGIEPEYHDKVFVIFQTLQARDVVESTGVGLAIVKKIVEEKGGKVWLESEKGKGANFYFTLPKI